MKKAPSPKTIPNKCENRLFLVLVSIVFCLFLISNLRASCHADKVNKKLSGIQHQLGLMQLGLMQLGLMQLGLMQLDLKQCEQANAREPRDHGTPKCNGETTQEPYSVIPMLDLMKAYR